MKAFALSVVAAVAIGVAAWAALDRGAQKPVETVFTTSGVRL
jgi:hypothetical protein